ncbi:MAG TPA: diguanylate cyclase [Rhodopseudomonas sp.]|uniref:GGDEF domain-containing protein n=1 Tax=Rhodopseudomonas sp. TaxID=1078 RepID=UPI002EDAC426
MLSVPTLWIVYIANATSLGLVWTYVSWNYPNFVAARYWAMGSFLAAVGASCGLLRGIAEPQLPVLSSTMTITLACFLGAMGIERFYGRPASWRLTAAMITLTTVSLTYFLVVKDDMELRIIIASFAVVVPMGMSIRHLISRKDGQNTPGSRVTGFIAALMMLVLVGRALAALFGIGGELSLVNFNPVQALLGLMIAFLSMTWSFGFLLMAIDRLRAEVAKLAMLDELTGAANRRQLLQRLAEECALSRRTGGPFALLAIDLDGFKAINDGYGHGTGDACLRNFTRTAQSCLRPSDLLARLGGDEFSVLLPTTTLREGAMVAHRILEACRSSGEGTAITISVSIGVAQWTKLVGVDAERLIAAADHALYAAKNSGKNRHAVYDPAAEHAEQAPPEQMPPWRKTA